LRDDIILGFLTAPRKSGLKGSLKKNKSKSAETSGGNPESKAHGNPWNPNKPDSAYVVENKCQ